MCRRDWGPTRFQEDMEADNFFYFLWRRDCTPITCTLHITTTYLMFQCTCVGMGGGTLFFSDIADEDQALFGRRSYCTTINDDVTMTS